MWPTEQLSRAMVDNLYGVKQSTGAILLEMTSPGPIAMKTTAIKSSVLILPAISHMHPPVLITGKFSSRVRTTAHVKIDFAVTTPLGVVYDPINGGHRKQPSVLFMPVRTYPFGFGASSILANTVLIMLARVTMS